MHPGTTPPTAPSQVAYRASPAAPHLQVHALSLDSTLPGLYQRGKTSTNPRAARTCESHDFIVNAAQSTPKMASARHTQKPSMPHAIQTSITCGSGETRHASQSGWLAAPQRSRSCPLDGMLTATEVHTASCSITRRTTPASKGRRWCLRLVCSRLATRAFSASGGQG